MTNTPTQKGSTMLAWHNDPALKAQVLARMLQHRVEDSIVQGAWQELAPEKASQYRGCLIGCTLPMGEVYTWTDCDNPGLICDHTDCDSHTEIMEFSSPMTEVETQYGIPFAVGELVERVFETLPVAKAPWFAVAFIEAIPVGITWTKVLALLEWRLREMFNDTRMEDSIYDIGRLVTLRQLFMRNMNYDDDHRLQVVKVAEMIIQVLQESKPEQLIAVQAPDGTGRTVAVDDVRALVNYTTQEDTRVPVA